MEGWPEIIDEEYERDEVDQIEIQQSEKEETTAYRTSIKPPNGVPSHLCGEIVGLKGQIFSFVSILSHHNLAINVMIFLNVNFVLMHTNLRHFNCVNTPQMWMWMSLLTCMQIN